MSLREVFVLFLTPVSLTFLSYPLLLQWPFARRLPKTDFFITLLVVSLFLLVFPLSLVGLLFPAGFKIFSLALFAIGLFGVFLFIRQGQYLSFLLASRHIMALKKAAFSDPLKAFLVAALIAFTAKLILFSLFRPIIDADPMTSSLPFARSIYIEDHIPPRSLYDGNPMLLPPIGSSLIFAWAYAAAGSYLSESFRLVMVPFYLGLLLITYLLGKKLVGPKAATIGTIIFTTLSINDVVLFEALFYPEVLFTFLALFVVYILAGVIFPERERNSVGTGILIGLALATSLIFKLQGIFLIYFVGVVTLLTWTGGSWRWRWFTLLVLVSPFLIREQLIYGFKPPPLVVTSSIILSLGFLFFLAGEKLNRGRRIKIGLLRSAFIFVPLSFLGGFWLLRNFLLYGNVASSPLSQSAAQFHFGYTPEEFVAGDEWAILIAPLLGTFLVIPKIYGLKEAIRGKLPLYLLLWTFVWYGLWISYLGSTDPSRYLLPLAPPLAIIIGLGLTKLETHFRGLKVSTMVVVLVLVGLAQSLFLWWNAAVLFRGPSVIPEGPGLPAEEVGQVKNPEVVLELIGRLLTVRDRVSYPEALALLLIGIAVFLLGWLVLALVKKWPRTPQVISGKAALIFGLILFLPYFFVFLLVGKGRLSDYPEEARSRVYTHWGRYNLAIPFLVREASPESTVLVIGHPTGFAYYTNRQVLSLNYGYKYEELAELLSIKEDEGLRRFLQENKIEFVALDTRDAQRGHHEDLRRRTVLLDLLENQDFFEARISPSPVNSWTIYQLK